MSELAWSGKGYCIFCLSIPKEEVVEEGVQCNLFSKGTAAGDEEGNVVLHGKR